MLLAKSTIALSIQAYMDQITKLMGDFGFTLVKSGCSQFHFYVKIWLLDIWFQACDLDCFFLYSKFTLDGIQGKPNMQS